MTENILISDIAVEPDRLRRLRPDLVNELAESIDKQGLLQPIIARPRKSGGYVLVAGWHRLEAVRKLGHWTIPAVVRDGADADRARLCEIDENLIRGELSPAERAQHFAERKRLYEAAHPETKHGATGRGRGKSRQLGDSNGRFSEDAAKKTGQSERKIQRDVQRAEQCVAVLGDVVGTSLDCGDELDALAKLPAAEQHKLAARAIAGEKVSAKTRTKQMRREERERELADKITALPDHRYGVIVTDPEWKDEVWSEETGMDRHASNHYPTSDAAVIASRPVASIAAKDCVLFLWTTNQHLRIALSVMEAWGFEYKSNYCWGKDHISTGRWNRSKHELLLIGARGKVPCPAAGTQWDSLILAPRGKHSEKPECFLEMIEAYYPNVPKIELNRRGPARPGWDCWGFEAKTETVVRAAEPPQHEPPSAPAEDADDDGIPPFLRRTVP